MERRLEPVLEPLGARFLVAADGAFSAARKIMMDQGLAQFVQDELDYGYKELPIDSARGRVSIPSQRMPACTPQFGVRFHSSCA